MQPAWDFIAKMKEQKPLLGEDPDFTTWFQNGEIDARLHHLDQCARGQEERHRHQLGRPGGGREVRHRRPVDPEGPAGERALLGQAVHQLRDQQGGAAGLARRPRPARRRAGPDAAGRPRRRPVLSDQGGGLRQADPRPVEGAGGERERVVRQVQGDHAELSARPSPRRAGDRMPPAPLRLAREGEASSRSARQPALRVSLAGAAQLDGIPRNWRCDASRAHRLSSDLARLRCARSAPRPRLAGALRAARCPTSCSRRRSCSSACWCSASSRSPTPACARSTPSTFRLSEDYTLANYRARAHRAALPQRSRSRSLLGALIVTVVDARPRLPLRLPHGAHAAPRALRKLLLIALFLPFFIGQVVRAYGWLIILGNQGLVNEALGLVGLGAVPAALQLSAPCCSAWCSTCCPSPC